MATYYETYIQSQEEKTRASMASARTELSAATKSQEAYRLLLRQQIEGLDKQIALIDRSTEKIAKSLDTTAKTKELLSAQQAQNRLEASNRRIAESAADRILRQTTYSDQNLATSKAALTGAVRTATTITQAEDMMEKAIAARSDLLREAIKATGGDPLKRTDAGIKFRDFILDRFEEAGLHMGDDAMRAANRLAAQRFEVPTAALDADALIKARDRSTERAVAQSQVSLKDSQALLDRLVAESKGQETPEIVSVRAAIAARKGEREDIEAERGRIEERLEALEAPTPVTEEAVRARAAEIRTGTEFDPFTDRVKDAPTLRERVFKEGQFAKKQEAKRAQQQRFAKMSQAEKIIMQQTIRAQRMLSESGDMLPPTRDSIEWNQAQSIYDQIKSGALDGKQAVAAAHSLAVETVGKQAPPSDIKRQRDQILERFMALRLQDHRAQRIDKPQTKTTPQDLERRAFEGTPMEGVRADLMERRPDIVAAEEGLPAPEVAAAPADDTEAVLASRAAGPAAPAPIPSVDGGVDFRPVSPEDIGVELPPVGADGLALLGGVGSTPIDIPGALRTSPQGSTDEELIAAAERVRDQSLLRQTQIGIPPEPQTDRQDVWGRPWDLGPPPETLDADERIAALGGELGSRMDPTEGGMRGHIAPPVLQAIEAAAGRSITNPELLVRRFAASTSMEEVPGSPAFHEALAIASQSMGLPVPRWYQGKSQTLVADAR